MDSSRIGLFGQGCVVMILAACAGCSSSSNPSTPEEDGSTSSSGSGSSGGSGSGGPGDGGNLVVVGDGGACMKTYPLSVGTLITATVSWPGTAAVAKGTGPYYLWLLTTYSVANGKITGTTSTCGTQPAILTLTQLGDMAEGAPAGQVGQVKPTYPDDSWTDVPSTPITGTLGGTDIGSSFEVDPNLTLQGLTPSDPLKDPTMKWPSSESALTQSDLTYADGGAYVQGVGQPGIRGVFVTTPPYYPGTTSLAPGAPLAADFWTVNRVQLSLYGKSTSCTETTGSAYVTLINNRIVGCSLANDGGACSQSQYGFLDENTTQYAPANGTFDAKDMAANATCADVLTALPLPM